MAHGVTHEPYWFSFQRKLLVSNEVNYTSLSLNCQSFLKNPSYFLEFFANIDQEWIALYHQDY
jgi:hypothetical protein